MVKETRLFHKGVLTMHFVEMNGYTIYENGEILGKKGKALKPYLHNGHAEVKINLDGSGPKHYTLSRLVYWAFHPEFDYDNKNMCVSCKTGNYITFTLQDLELKPRKDLIQGELHKSCAKLTDHEVHEIRRLYQGKAGSNQFDKTSLSQNDLAQIFGVSRSNISLITRQKGRTPLVYKLLA